MARRLPSAVAFLALLVLLAAPAARAGTATATLNVRATVEPECTIASGTLDFGTYRSGQSDHLPGEATLNISNCAADSVVVRLGAGNSGDPARRYMTATSGDTLRYQLFTDPGRSNPWVGAVQMGYTDLNPGNTYPIRIYGLIYGGQAVQPGVYTDTIDVLVEF